MALLFRDKVFTMLIKEGKISEALAQKISSWPHSGFNIHNEVEIDADDEKGKENLTQYIIKAPISQERMIYDKEKQKVIYNSKRGTVFWLELSANGFSSNWAFTCRPLRDRNIAYGLFGYWISGNAIFRNRISRDISPVDKKEI